MGVVADFEEGQRQGRERIYDGMARIFPPLQAVVAVGSMFLPVGGGVGREDLFRLVLAAIFGILAIQNLVWWTRVERLGIIIAAGTCGIAMIVHGFVIRVMLPGM